jgi:hypothetical protein
LTDRRSLALGVVLLLLGAFFLLSRALDLRGPGPILALIGAILLSVSALRRFRGPLLPGGVLLGLGSGFLVTDALSGAFPRWATLLLGLGCGFLLVAALDRLAGRERRPAPLVPGVLLVAIALAAALARGLDLAGVFERLVPLWPWALIAAGVALVAVSLRRRAGVRS